jgi:hypothetical protein
VKAATASYAFTYASTCETVVGRLTVVRMTAVKFKPLIFSMHGFFLLNFTYISILVKSNGFCLFSAQFSYVIVDLRKSECHVEISDRRAPVSVAHDKEKSFLRALQFQ